MSQFFIDQIKSERELIKTMSKKILENHTITKDFWPGTQIQVCIYCGKTKLTDPHADDIEHSNACLVTFAANQIERLKGLK